MKKYGRVKNYIYGIFFVCLLVCGFCVDDVSAGSFLRIQSDITQEDGLPAEDEMFEQEIWDEDEVLLQQRDLRLLQYARRESCKGCWRNIFDLLLLGFALPMLLEVCSASGCQYYINGFNHKYIIGYIHQTDGEKEL